MNTDTKKKVRVEDLTFAYLFSDEFEADLRREQEAELLATRKQAQLAEEALLAKEAEAQAAAAKKAADEQARQLQLDRKHAALKQEVLDAFHLNRDYREAYRKGRAVLKEGDDDAIAAIVAEAKALVAARNRKWLWIDLCTGVLLALGLYIGFAALEKAGVPGNFRERYPYFCMALALIIAGRIRGRALR